MMLLKYFGVHYASSALVFRRYLKHRSLDLFNWSHECEVIPRVT